MTAVVNKIRDDLKALDPDVAAAQRVPVRGLAFVYLVLLALVVAIAVQVVGVLLIFALLVTPAAIASSLTTHHGAAGRTRDRTGPQLYLAGPRRGLLHSLNPCPMPGN